MATTTTARLSPAQIATVMRQAGWPESAIPVGVAIALAESGGKPNAVNHANRNGSSDYGLFQINTVHGDLLKSGNWASPVDNARMALKVYRDAGSSWKPWSTFNSGSYRKFYRGTLPVGAAISPDPSAGTSTDTTGGMGEGLGGGLFSLGFIGSQAFWQRFGLALLGILLIIIGVWIVFRQPISKAASAISNVVPAGRVANIAKGVMENGT